MLEVVSGFFSQLFSTQAPENVAGRFARSYGLSQGTMPRDEPSCERARLCQVTHHLISVARSRRGVGRSSPRAASSVRRAHRTAPRAIGPRACDHRHAERRKGARGRRRARTRGRRNTGRRTGWRRSGGVASRPSRGPARAASLRRDLARVGHVCERSCRRSYYRQAWARGKHPRAMCGHDSRPAVCGWLCVAFRAARRGCNAGRRQRGRGLGR